MGILKIYAYNYGPLIKMADMPIYGKNTKNFSRTKKVLRLNLGI